MKTSSILGLGTIILSAGFSAAASASIVSVIDSGVDYKHKDFSANNYFLNAAESKGQAGTDDDGNGFVDDVYGWNFAEKNKEVIDYKYLGTFSEKPKRFFIIQDKMMRGTATQEEQEWIKKERENEETIKELQKFGNFVHGTHVAGTASVETPSSNKVFGVKLIPTESPLSVEDASWEMSRAILPKFLSLNFVEMQNTIIAKMMLSQLAKRQAGGLVPSGQYTGKQKADVANCSFGIPYQAAETIATSVYKMFAKTEPSAEELKDMADHFMAEHIKASAAFTNAASGTLFVMAAGNDGNNNDVKAASPANVKSGNTISVAATIDRKSLAKFSNYGVVNVDVAAPGVGIDSTIPGNERLKMSGTSMAAPYVAHVSGLVKDGNPQLSPAQMRQLLIETVDYKDFLKGKVLSGGIVNLGRAVKAAELSKTMDLARAIAEARNQVGDVSSPMSIKSLKAARDIIPVAMPVPMFQ